MPKAEHQDVVVLTDILIENIELPQQIKPQSKISWNKPK